MRRYGRFHLPTLSEQLSVARLKPSKDLREVCTATKLRFIIICVTEVTGLWIATAMCSLRYAPRNDSRGQGHFSKDLREVCAATKSCAFLALSEQLSVAVFAMLACNTKRSLPRLCATNGAEYAMICKKMG